MILERTICQLDIGPVPPDRARELGQMGYLQWLGSLPPMASYPRAAMQAYEIAAPLGPTSPAVAAFCDLLVASTRSPLEPLDLSLPTRQRRGGSKARRTAL